MKIVLDTNVLVAGLLSPHGPPARILQGIVAGQHELCYSWEIIAEYREVLQRPRFGFSPQSVADLLETLEVEGLAVEPGAPVRNLPDPDDAIFLAVALAAGADCLVTGNLRHFPQRCRQGVDVLTPAEFVAACRRQL